MFDNLVAAHGPSPRRRARNIVVTTSVIAHAAALVALAVMAMWRIDKLELGYHGNRANALELPRNTGGGALAKREALVAKKEEPKVIREIPKVVVQPEKRLVKDETPVTDATSEGGGDTSDTGASGDGGGGDGKGVGTPDTTDKCLTDKCLGGGTGGEEPKVLECKKGEKLVEHKCVKDVQVATVAPDVMKGLRKSGNDQIPAPQSVRVAMMHEGKSRVVGTVKLCIGTDGHIDRAQLLKSTGYDAYDDLLVSEMKAWRYKPYTVEGEAVPACTAVTVVYVMQK